MVVIASNKGLCGAFNSNVIKEANKRIEYYLQSNDNISLSLMTIGKRSTDFFSKRSSFVTDSYIEILDKPSFDSISKVAETIMKRFCEKKYDKVELIYNRFKNSLTQIVSVEQFLPILTNNDIKEQQSNIQNDYIYEPDKKSILLEMIPLSLRSQFYRVILDSLASEHGARMTAMQKATDNATELLKELKLTYNKARQTSITNEIIEIVSGAEALNG